MRSRRRPATTLVIAGLAALAGISGRAQDAPTPLLPPVLGTGSGAVAGPPGGRLAAPPSPSARPVFPGPARPAAGMPGTLPAGSLGTLPSTAIPGPANGALAEALERIDGPLPSPGLQTVARDLLLDRAVAGASDPLDRARALYAIGFIEDAAGAAVERPPATVAERAMAARALLALGRDEQACERVDVESLPKDAEPGPTFELLEALAFCKLAQGAAEAAEQIAGLLRDQGGGDALYFAAFKAAAGGGRLPEMGEVERVRPIHLALMRRAGVALTPELAASADLALTAVLARSPDAAIGVRLVAAERAVAAGLMPADALIDLYIGTPLDEALLMRAATGRAPEGALARAHLFALMAEAPTDAERMAFAAEIYRQGEAAEVGTAVAEALGEDVAGITASPELGRWAAIAVEILVRADRARVAVPWIDAGDLPGPGGKPAFDRLASHFARALIAISAPDLGLGVAAGALGADVGGGKLAEADRAVIARETSLMAALGDPVPPVLVEVAGRPTDVARPAAGPVAVLGALAPLAGAGFAEVSDADAAASVAALAGSGATVEARRAAVEALIARRPG